MGREVRFLIWVARKSRYAAEVRPVTLKMFFLIKSKDGFGKREKKNVKE
jgi:hypothetical protein